MLYAVLAIVGLLQTVFGGLFPADSLVAKILVAASAFSLAVAAGNVPTSSAQPPLSPAEVEAILNRIQVLKTLVPGWWWSASTADLPAAARDVLDGIRSLVALVPGKTTETPQAP
ncbi:MAG: hypothetical protein Q7V57_11315 [Actinomycetota bacterium]|nr:hypothetical protein [Actinomycetota bacterium]